MSIIYRFRLSPSDQWSYSGEPPALDGIPHEVERFVPESHLPQRARRGEPMNFLTAMNIVERGFDTWKDKPFNAGWYSRIDGTPIPNDLKVNIAEAICHYCATPSGADVPGHGVRVADIVDMIRGGLARGNTIDRIAEEIAREIDQGADVRAALEKLIGEADDVRREFRKFSKDDFEKGKTQGYYEGLQRALASLTRPDGEVG